MVDTNFIEGWLEFQATEEFDTTVAETEKWIYSMPCQKSNKNKQQAELIIEDSSSQIDYDENMLHSADFFLEQGVSNLKINENSTLVDKENTDHHSIPSKSNLATMKFKNLSNVSIQELFEFESDLKSKMDYTTKDDDDPDELILDELPDFKNMDYRKKEESLCVTPAALNEHDGETKYLKDITEIEDKSWLPRHHQHHRIKLKLLHDKDSIYQYYKNPNCPKSRDDEFDDHSLKNLSFHRYSRKLKTSNKVEIMCRLCRGKNWIPKTKFNFHMAFSHGVLLPYNQHLHIHPTLLPLPESLFISRSRKLTSFFLKCPDCCSWIKLGLRADARKMINKNGLYHNYFLHFLKCHGSVTTPNVINH